MLDFCLDRCGSVALSTCNLLSLGYIRLLDTFSYMAIDMAGFKFQPNL